MDRASSFSPSTSRPYPRASQTRLLTALSSFCGTGSVNRGTQSKVKTRSPLFHSHSEPQDLDSRPLNQAHGPRGHGALWDRTGCGPCSQLCPFGPSSPGPCLLQRTGQPALHRARPPGSEFAGSRGSVLSVLPTGEGQSSHSHPGGVTPAPAGTHQFQTAGSPWHAPRAAKLLLLWDPHLPSRTAMESRNH